MSLPAAAKRGLDIVVSLVGLVLTAPLVALAAAAMAARDPGPVFYRDEREGKDGRRFGLLKLRTMVVDGQALLDRRLADDASARDEWFRFYRLADDPRVASRAARWVRRSSIDEIPQLLNVLRGEMNIVGPRPERPTIFAELREHIAEYPLRQRTKPGITGLAQINHHYDRSLDDVRTKVRYDLEYIRRQSLREDVRIMLKTLPVILFRRGGW